jgi:hypothetical protein
MVVARTPLEEISRAESRDYLGACTLFLPSPVLKVAQIASEGFLGQGYVLRKSYSVSYSFRTNSGV